jgi:hypothetical protein
MTLSVLPTLTAPKKGSQLALCGRHTDNSPRLVSCSNHGLINILPAKEREVLLLAAAKGLSTVEIALVLRTTGSTIRSRLTARVRPFRSLSEPDGSLMQASILDRSSTRTRWLSRILLRCLSFPNLLVFRNHGLCQLGFHLAGANPPGACRTGP